MLPKFNADLTNPVEKIFSGQLVPGIYRLRSELNADHIVAPLNKVGWRGFYIEGQIVTSKEAFLRMAGATMSFPGYYGQNWDAFEECVTDLSWIPAKGYVLIYDNVWHFPHNDRPAWQQARAILADAVTFWGRREVPFYVFLRHARWYAREIPKI